MINTFRNKTFMKILVFHSGVKHVIIRAPFLEAFYTILVKNRVTLEVMPSRPALTLYRGWCHFF